MVNPLFIQKEEAKFTPNESVKKLFQVIYRQQNKEESQSDEPKIRVSEIISKMSFYYEKIRNTVDDKEEHLLYKNAIDRILKRQINIEMTKDGKQIAKHLLVELIRAGYLANNKLPESKIDEIGLIINRYLRFKKVALDATEQTLEFKERLDLARWIIAIAACEIEEKLRRSKVDQVIVGNMYDMLGNSIELPPESKFHQDREIQIYVSIYRSYFRADRDMVSHILFKYYIRDWQNANDEQIVKIATNIVHLRDAINKQIDHPLAAQISKIVNRYYIYYSILTEVVSNDPRGVYENLQKDPKAFPRDIKVVCGKRYKSAKAKLWRAGIRSIIYLFITKSIVVLILEIPVAQLLGETINNNSLAINVAFPPVLLFFIILFSALPTDKNTARIIEGIEELTFVEKKRKEPIMLRIYDHARSKIKNWIFGAIYIITFFVSFGGVVYLLRQINFNLVSIAIFTLFLALISFFSVRIRKRVRELFVIDAKENLLMFVVDFFYIPIMAVGRILSENFSKLNVFVLIMDFIIEAPFKIFVEIAEEWTKYIRERKDDISQ
ncbi:MAG: hypothetical protein WCG01_01005 [bacterium]